MMDIYNHHKIDRTRRFWYGIFDILCIVVPGKDQMSSGAYTTEQNIRIASYITNKEEFTFFLER